MTAKVQLALIKKAVREVVDGIPFGVHDGKLLMLRNTTEHELVEWVEKVYALKEKVRDR